MPAKRVLISVDERLLTRVDAECARLGIGRSTYLAQLAAVDLEGGSGPGADARVHTALRSIDALLRDAEQ